MTDISQCVRKTLKIEGIVVNKHLLKHNLRRGEGDRFGVVGFGAAGTRPDGVWRGPLGESAARSSLALTGRGSRRFSSDPLKPHVYKRPSSLAVFRVPSALPRPRHLLHDSLRGFPAVDESTAV